MPDRDHSIGSSGQSVCDRATIKVVASAGSPRAIAFRAAAFRSSYSASSIHAFSRSRAKDLCAGFSNCVDRRWHACACLRNSSPLGIAQVHPPRDTLREGGTRARQYSSALNAMRGLDSAWRLLNVQSKSGKQNGQFMARPGILAHAPILPTTTAGAISPIKRYTCSPWSATRIQACAMLSNTDLSSTDWT
jgi:hypothetical protein